MNERSAPNMLQGVPGDPTETHPCFFPRDKEGSLTDPPELAGVSRKHNARPVENIDDPVQSVFSWNEILRE